MGAEMDPAANLDPATVALHQTVLKLTGEVIDWQARAIGLQREVEDLKLRLAEAQKRGLHVVTSDAEAS